MENLTKPLIEIQDLKQHFKIKGGLFGRATQTVKAVDGVSFNIYRGETFMHSSHLVLKGHPAFIFSKSIGVPSIGINLSCLISILGSDFKSPKV